MTRLKSLMALMLGMLLLCENSGKAEPLKTETRQPLIVAHRGLLNSAPENTLANFRACLELRFGFEFDVQKTADGELVCIHDTTLDRTTNGTGKVSNLTLAELRKLDAGSWFDSKFAGEKIPTIKEVFKLVGEYSQHNILVAVDFKSPGVATEVVKLAEAQKVMHRLLFIGTTIVNPDVRSEIRRASKQAQIAVVANHAGEFSAALNDEIANWVYVRYLPSPEEIRAVHKTKKRMFIAGATVSGNVPKNWQQVIDVKIDGILTDYPLELRTLLRSSNQEH